jgi:GntR family histidine utilization transcriptional repressor
MVSTNASHLPIHGALAPFAKVKQFLKAELVGGRWPPGALMPSEAELVGQFKVSRMTVNRALRELQGEGLVERVQGVGTFAAQPHKVAATLTIRDLHQEIEARGHTHHSVVHLATTEAATADLALQLGMPEGDHVFHTLIVHFENGLPLQCEDRYVNPDCAPDYIKQDFTHVTPTRYLLQVSPYVDAQYSIEAASASATEAKLLGMDAGAPCLVVVRRTTRLRSQLGDSGGPHLTEGITIARLVHPGNRYSLQGQFQ